MFSVSSTVFDVGALEKSVHVDGGIVSTVIGVGSGSVVTSAMHIILDEQTYPLGQGWSWLHGMTVDSSSSNDEVDIPLDTAEEDSDVVRLVK